MLKCNEEGNFHEAKLSKERIEQFKKVEKRKMRQELSQKQADEIASLENDFKNELDRHDQETAKKEEESKDKYEKEKDKLDKNHEKKLAICRENFEKEYPKQPKYSPQIKNLEKQLEFMSKQKEYLK